MKRTLSSPSIVILANSHNPTILSGSFLIKSGIIRSEKEVDNSANFIITQVASQLRFTNGTSISVTTGNLTIKNNSDSEDPFKKAQKYCKELPHISATGLGINLAITLDEIDSKSWFKSRLDKEGIENIIVKHTKIHSGGQCNVTISSIGKNSLVLDFNYDYGSVKDVVLGDIKMDFVAEYKLCVKDARSHIDLIFDKTGK